VSKRRKIPDRVQKLVRERANYLCEYCHTNEKWQYVPFTIEHILPLSKNGSNEPENLCLACFHCNRRKSDLVEAKDPESNQLQPLFNPRKELWHAHFIWSQDKLNIVAVTPIGRATLSLLALNRERVLKIREDDLEVNRHPPSGDPVLPKSESRK